MNVGRLMRGRGVVIAAAVLTSALLLGSALLIRSTAQDASELAVRGTGEAFVLALEDALMNTQTWPPNSNTLSDFLAEREEDGLRYVAILFGDETLAAAGTPTGSVSKDGTLERIGPRVRMVERIRPTKRPRGLRRLPRPNAPWARRGPPLVVYEFEPVAALALEAQANRLVGIAGLASVAILGLAFAFARGLAQREALQTELERGKRLAALGSMSAVLAHELRNPLASLKGHAQLLAEDVEEDPRLSPRAGRVVGEAVRLEKLMDDLLTFVRSGELHRTPTDPDEVLRAAIAQVSPEGIETRFLGAGQRWSLDGGRLQQALENILRNARQASPEGGRVEVAVDGTREAVVYTIRDHGPGLPVGDEERIFEPFVTGKIRGVGLGLAITRRVAELHGGTVTARNHPDGGAEFRLAIPKKES